jgi:hypothetical protein
MNELLSRDAYPLHELKSKSSSILEKVLAKLEQSSWNFQKNQNFRIFEFSLKIHLIHFFIKKNFDESIFFFKFLIQLRSTIHCKIIEFFVEKTVFASDGSGRSRSCREGCRLRDIDMDSPNTGRHSDLHHWQHPLRPMASR